MRKVIGPFAAPKKIYLVSDLPKTRSGKVRSLSCRLPSRETHVYVCTCVLTRARAVQIMRRIMRKIVAGEADQLGDLSTLADPSVVDVIKAKVASS